MGATSESRGGLGSEAWSRLERVVARFEAAWFGGGRPALEEYLAGSDGERHRLLVELIHVELECRLKAGEPVRVESYLKRYPELNGDQEGLLGLIAGEYELRRRTEPDLDPKSYFERFPYLKGFAFLLTKQPSIRFISGKSFQPAPDIWR